MYLSWIPLAFFGSMMTRSSFSSWSSISDKTEILVERLPITSLLKYIQGLFNSSSRSASRRHRCCVIGFRSSRFNGRPPASCCLLVVVVWGGRERGKEQLVFSFFVGWLDEAGWMLNIEKKICALIEVRRSSCLFANTCARLNGIRRTVFTVISVWGSVGRSRTNTNEEWNMNTWAQSPLQQQQ